MIEVSPGNFEWKPTQRQADYLSVPDASVFERLYGGAAGGGKSELLLMHPVLKGYHNEPNFRGIVFRRTFPELERSLIDRAKTKLYPHFGGRYDGQRHVWEFPSKAKMFFGYLDRPQDVIAHDSAEYNYIGWEEVTAQEEYQYRYLTSRCRSSNNVPSFMCAASNPGGIGHFWVKKRFIDPAPLGYQIIYDTLTKTKRIFIPSKATDNPYLLKNDPLYIERLRILPLIDQKMKIDGDWNAIKGEVFGEFRYKKFHDEPSNALHVIEPFVVPAWWPKFVSVDWGWDAMCYVIFSALSPDGRLYIYREVGVRQENVEVWASRIGDMIRGDGELGGVAIDKSATQNRGLGKTILQQFIEYSGIDSVQLSNSDRIAGKQVIHEFLRWKARPSALDLNLVFDEDVYLKIYRLRGGPAAQEYQNMFIDTRKETNIPKLQIFQSCPLLIQAITRCQVSEKNSEDVQEFKGDDPYDALRYLLFLVKAYDLDTSEESVLRNQRQQILDEYSHTNNYRVMDWKMRILEEKQGNSFGKGVSRFHHGRPN